MFGNIKDRHEARQPQNVSFKGFCKGSAFLGKGYFNLTYDFTGKAHNSGDFKLDKYRFGAYGDGSELPHFFASKNKSFRLTFRATNIRGVLPNLKYDCSIFITCSKVLVAN